MARGSKHHFRARCASFACMTREILRPDVSLGFDDAPDNVTFGMSPHQILSQKLLGDIDCSLFVKRARQFHTMRRSNFCKSFFRIANDWQLMADRYSLTRLRQSVLDLHPRSFRAHMRVFGNLDTRIAVQSPRPKAEVFRVFVFLLNNRRPASPAENPVIAGRGVPLLEQFFTGDKSERSRRNCRPARK